MYIYMPIFVSSSFWMRWTVLVSIGGMFLFSNPWVTLFFSVAALVWAAWTWLLPHAEMLIRFDVIYMNDRRYLRGRHFDIEYVKTIHLRPLRYWKEGWCSVRVHLVTGEVIAVTAVPMKGLKSVLQRYEKYGVELSWDWPKETPVSQFWRKLPFVSDQAKYISHFRDGRYISEWLRKELET